MVSVYPNPPAGQDFYGYYPMGEPMMNRTGLPGMYSLQPDPNGNFASGNVNNSVNMDSGAGFVGLEDPNKKVRKPYTITKSRENWTEQEHDKFLEALQLFDRDWKKIEAFIGSKTVIQIRSHAQKYFQKVQKSGANEHVPPPRPKRKASHPYPQKAGKNAVSQVKAPLQSSAPTVDLGRVVRSDSLVVSGNSVNPSLSTWTYGTIPTLSISHGTKDFMVSSTVTQNCSSSSSESAPKIQLTIEANQGKENQEKATRAMPDFAQVYSFIGSLFDPNSSEQLKRLRKMDPIDVETVLMLMKNLSVNLVTPEFEGHRQLLSSYNRSVGKDKSTPLTKNHQAGMSSGAVASA